MTADWRQPIYASFLMLVTHLNNQGFWIYAYAHFFFFTDLLLQKHILSLNGPVVTAAGFSNELAIVTHVSDCLPSNEQVC